MEIHTEPEMGTPAPTTMREDLTTVGLATWMILGLMVNAYFHSTDADLETFFTPWHGLFYSGFIATAVWLIRLALARRHMTGNILTWAPPGYRSALIGLGVFAPGGAGDTVWHVTLGIETGLEMLLSPTHLTLFVGMLLIVSAPFRAAWTAQPMPSTPPMSKFVAPLLSMTWA